MFVAIAVLLLHLYVYYGDPATFSNAESFGTLIGDIYAGWFAPGPAGFVVARLFVMVLLAAGGVWSGIKLHRMLRDRCQLTMFGYDRSQGADEYRNPLSSQDGAVFIVFMLVVLFWFIGLKLYNGLLSLCGQTQHRTDAGMPGWTYAAYNLALAGLLTWVSDVYLVATVADQMLQALALKRCAGYLAYGRTERTDRAAAWWKAHRLAVTRVFLLVGWVGGVYWQTSAWLKVENYLWKDGRPNRHIGRSMFWTRSWSTEFMRMLGGCLAAAGSMLIVMQDWDFPDFSGEDIKIVAVDFDAIHFQFPKWVYDLPPLYISSKWFNYFGVLTGIAFDWGYWYMTALPFRPCDYGMLWDKHNDLMYMLAKPQRLVDHHVGAPGAKDCPWFTDNALLRYAREPWNQTQWELETGKTWKYGNDPSLVRIDCGSFTGTYTLNEDDEMVWFRKGAWIMNLMCAIPILTGAALFWMVANHEHVTCFNKKKVKRWAAGMEEDSTATESQKQLAEKAMRDADKAHCCGTLCCLRGTGRVAAPSPEAPSAETPPEDVIVVADAA